MLCSRFRKMNTRTIICLFTFLLMFNSTAHAQKFNSKQCLDATFDTSIKHEGKFFGLIKNELTINKSQCIINIKFKNILETKWLIDICREPIHIKVTSKGSQNVFKRVEKCEKNDQTDYCTYWQELYETLQDYGLIFAEGERENLQESHGQTYCTYLILKRYLGDGYLFSKYDNPGNIFNGTSAPAASIPVAAMVKTSEEVQPIEPKPVTEAISKETIESKADELIEESSQF